jgi:hypothetical protein
MSSPNPAVETASQVIPWEVIKQLRADILAALYTNGRIGNPNQNCVGHTSNHDIVEKDGCWLLRVTDRKTKKSQNTTKSSGGKTRTYLKGLIQAPVAVKSNKYRTKFEYRGKTPPTVNIAALILMASKEMHERYYKGGDARWVCGHTCHRNTAE